MCHSAAGAHVRAARTMAFRGGFLGFLGFALNILLTFSMRHSAADAHVRAARAVVVAAAASHAQPCTRASRCSSRRSSAAAPAASAAASFA